MTSNRIWSVKFQRFVAAA